MEKHNALLADFLEALADLQSPHLWKEIAVVLVSLALGWLASRAVKPRIHTPQGFAWKLGAGGLNRMIFPLVAVLLVFMGRHTLFKGESARLLNVAVPLLISFVLIRLALYVLRHSFAPNPTLKAFERGIAFVIWGGLALYITGLWPYIAEFLDEVNFTAGKQKISLLLILQAIVTVSVTLVVALWLARLTETKINRFEQIDLSLRVMLGKLARAGLLVIGVLIALPMVGIDVTLLSVFGGALGVGIGFGLQKIASNYMSGFIILLERSVRLGDLVTVDNKHGVISQLNARYTVVKSADGSESIIPNESLIVNSVVNHSFSDKRFLLRLPLQVSYDSPLEQALQVCTAAAQEHPRVLDDPKPGAFVKGFGDNGIDLELAVWIIDPEQGQGPLRSELYLAIWKGFQNNGIQIPYPQREVRMLGAAGGRA
jgi:small-conductance mechanosensitive channel